MVFFLGNLGVMSRKGCLGRVLVTGGVNDCVFGSKFYLLA